MNDTSMNSATNNAPNASNAEVDQQHPWLGLASFTEETRQYFYGREEEVAELARRVQRKLLTVLFGQSGLGKTSILSAGIVPRLRPEGYCPIYVRIDYSSDAVSPSDQIKQAILRATETSGTWTQPGTAVEGESLWEFLHHRDDVLRDAEGKPIIPLLIFDQFEEIFTLAQADDAGRKRAAIFIEDLADLVENRPPKALEAKLDLDDSVIDRFDFGRADYRVLIALREDYLAHLEGVKTAMPSITQNRMRLARMNGQQALAAVVKPGGRLVSQEVAESIVRFVAGGSELPNAEVEPSLLSLICRELNNARLAQGKSEISVDLLAGSNETILAEFYERSLADQPAAVRKVIEDDLLTDSGYRENLAEERVLKAFTAAGAKPDAATTLATLVNRRLLRIEERLDVRRVELTHDVLTGVVAASRKARLEREALEESDRQLAAQKARAQATRKALIRARQIAAGCAVLSVVAIVSAIYGAISARRAHEAENEAVKTRAVSEASRSEAEKLVVFLLDDFYDELSPSGRLDAVGSLAKSAVAYYKELPAELRTPASQRNHALALLRQGDVALAQGQVDEAGTSVDSAARLVEGVRTQGDVSDATTLAMAYARIGEARVLGSKAKPAESVQKYREALDVLKSVLVQPNPPRRASLLAGHAYLGMGQTLPRLPNDGSGKNLRDAVEYFKHAKEIARGLRATELTDLPATELYLNANVWLANTAYDLGRPGEVPEFAKETNALANRLLALRPDHRPALQAAATVASRLADIDYDNGRVSAALSHFRERRAVQEKILSLDKSSISAWATLARAKLDIADALRDLGRISESLRERQELLDFAGQVKMNPSVARGFRFWSGLQAMAYQNMGYSREAEAALDKQRKFEALGKIGNVTDTIVSEATAAVEARVMSLAGNHAEGRTRSQQILTRLKAAADKLPPNPGLEMFLLGTIYEASYALGDYPAAEAAVRQQEPYFKKTLKPGAAPSEFQYYDAVARAAKTAARQGRHPEAWQHLAPAMKVMLGSRFDTSEDQEHKVARCNILLTAALANPAERKAYLAKASALFATLSPEIKRWHSFAVIGEEIARELQN